MSKQDYFVAYLAVKTVLIAMATGFTVCGLQSLLSGGGHATTAVCLWLGGVLAYGCAGLEE